MNHRTKRLFASMAVMLMAMCAVFAITFSDEEGSEVYAADASYNENGNNVTGTVGSSMNAVLFEHPTVLTSSRFNTYDIISDNIPDNLGLSLELTLDGSRMNLRLTGSPLHTINSHTSAVWNGNYTVQYQGENNAGDKLTYTITGTVTINAPTQSGDTIDAGSSTSPLPFIDKAIGQVDNRTQYYVYTGAKIFIQTPYYTTVTSGYGVEFTTDNIGGFSGAKIIGYVTKAGTFTHSYWDGSANKSIRITAYDVDQTKYTGSASSPLDEINLTMGSFNNIDSNNMSTSDVGNPLTFYVEVGSPINIYRYVYRDTISYSSVSGDSGVYVNSSGDIKGTASTPGAEITFTMTFNGSNVSSSRSSTIVVIDPDHDPLTNVTLRTSGSGDSITVSVSVTPSNASVVPVRHHMEVPTTRRP